MNQFRTIGAALVALLLFVRAASADPITFTYSILSTTASNNNDPVGRASFWIGDGVSKWAPPGTISAWGNFNGPIDDLPILATFTNVPISVTVSLTDSAAKAVAGAVPTGTLVFNSLLSGAYNHAMDAWNLTAFPSMETITLGSPGQFHTYAVGAPYLWNPSFGDSFATLPIQVSDYQPGIDPAPGSTSSMSTAPEPASLALAAMAMPALLVIIRHKRRQRSMPGSAWQALAGVAPEIFGAGILGPFVL